MSRAYLVILGDHEAISWVLSEQRMAFPATRRAEVSALSAKDRLFLYATRGAWHNPARDRGRIIGTATTRSSVQILDAPIEIAGRTFASGCDLRIDGLVPRPGGLELQPLVEQLSAFPKPHAWSAYLRRALLALPAHDAKMIDHLLNPLLMTRAQALATYTASSARIAPGPTGQGESRSARLLPLMRRRLVPPKPNLDSPNVNAGCPTLPDNGDHTRAAD